MSRSDIIGVWKKRIEKITIHYLNREEQKIRNGAKESVNYSSIWEGGCSLKMLMRTTTD
jgi:hypothetical protein